MLVLIESEMRSLIRNAIERILGKQFKNKEILLKLSIRVISSLIGIYIFNQIKKNDNIRVHLSYCMIFIFVYFLYREYN
tara:strand:- start:225 stop:461 length:237 start_codon:yes stop_codon:yes gene_type:complete